MSPERVCVTALYVYSMGKSGPLPRGKATATEWGYLAWVEVYDTIIQKKNDC